MFEDVRYGFVRYCANLVKASAHFPQDSTLREKEPVCLAFTVCVKTTCLFFELSFFILCITVGYEYQLPS